MTSGVAHHGLPPFPRIPHLVAPAGGARGDRIMTALQRQSLLASHCTVEEKLDGANVTIFRDTKGLLDCASRGGPGALDRGHLVGRVRAWMAKRHESLDRLLADGEVLYGEWMSRRHTVAYDALPDLLIVLDLWSAARGFATVDERDALSSAQGFSTPPVLARFTPRSIESLRRLHGKSVFGGDLAEGLMIRAEEGRGLFTRGKLLAPGFERAEALGRHGDNGLRGGHSDH